MLRRKVIYVACVMAVTVLLFFLIQYLYVFRHKEATRSKQHQALARENWYFAALLYNNQDILQQWTEQLLQVLLMLQHAQTSIFVSIVENGDSTDDTREMLQKFEKILVQHNIRHHFVLQRQVHRMNRNRVPILVDLRNLAMQPLLELREWNMNRTKIVFLNDVMLRADWLVDLMGTNGMQYDGACGLDFMFHFYDTWVTRDLQGNGLLFQYPYFQDATAQQLVREGKPVRVFSCWNGVAIMKAEPVYYYALRYRLNRELEGAHSECFFVWKDMWRLGYNRIFINPNVKWGYHQDSVVLHNYIFAYTMNYVFDWYYWLSGKTRQGNAESACNGNCRISEMFEKFEYFN